MAINEDGSGAASAAGGGGGGGGPATIADGADIAQGSTADVAVVSDVAGTQAGKLRGIVKILASVWDSINGRLKVDASGTTVPVSGTFFPPTQAVSGTFFQATQPVSGTVGATQSGTWTVQPGNTPNTVAWKVDGSAVTQPVSGSVSVSNFPASQAVTGTFFQATQPVSGTVTANQGTTPWVENVSQIGGVAAPAATAKGTQGSAALPVQDLKDAGRTPLTIILDGVAGITTEALATMTINKAGTVTTGATYTVTAGKTLRLSYFGTSTKNTSTVATNSRVRLRQAAAVSATSPIIIANECGTAAAVASVSATDDTNLAEGFEIAAAQQLGISHLESATTSTVSCCLIGYEY